MKQENFLKPNNLTNLKILSILRNLMVQYCIHKSLPPVPILRQICPVHATSSPFSNMYFHIILLSKPESCVIFYLSQYAKLEPTDMFNDHDTLYEYYNSELGKKIQLICCLYSSSVITQLHKRVHTLHCFFSVIYSSSIVQKSQRFLCKCFAQFQLLCAHI
jgi:hypothetical protein